VLLAVDAGNTNTVVGLFAGHRLVDHWRISTTTERTADELGLLIGELLTARSHDPGAIDGAAVACTVPRFTPVVRETIERHLGVPLVVLGPGTRTGVAILYDDPHQVGPDRIANAVAAHERFGGPTIVVDFGTATTVDVTSGEGAYLGGAILPGIEISLDALMARAAALAWVELTPPERVIGRNTLESVSSGVLLGFASAVDGLCRRFEAELGPCTVVSTGGLGDRMAPLSERIEHHEPWLTLHGLRLVYDRNR